MFKFRTKNPIVLSPSLSGFIGACFASFMMVGCSSPSSHWEHDIDETQSDFIDHVDYVKVDGEADYTVFSGYIKSDTGGQDILHAQISINHRDPMTTLYMIDMEELPKLGLEKIITFSITWNETTMVLKNLREDKFGGQLEFSGNIALADFTFDGQSELLATIGLPPAHIMNEVNQLMIMASQDNVRATELSKEFEELLLANDNPQSRRCKFSKLLNKLSDSSPADRIAFATTFSYMSKGLGILAIAFGGWGALLSNLSVFPILVVLGALANLLGYSIDELFIDYQDEHSLRNCE